MSVESGMLAKSAVINIGKAYKNILHAQLYKNIDIELLIASNFLAEMKYEAIIFHKSKKNTILKKDTCEKSSERKEKSIIQSEFLSNWMMPMTLKVFNNGEYSSWLTRS
ncbi:hypothetical protein T02_2131 [Trichinella nativa]|uniref:Uncharacterized protein n=1 Tax=Trichinella nativa TaxID=6335 RepID=A0A0V1LAP4_9BILA|nr:hypothetical protein T02_2131 [Trichinella nativa]